MRQSPNLSDAKKHSDEDEKEPLSSEAKTNLSDAKNHQGDKDARSLEWGKDQLKLRKYV